MNENGVNSGNIFQDTRNRSMKDNPDPSETRNSFEGATTR